jgi:predicted dehydrogenase
MTSKVRIGLIGVGFGSRVLLPAFRRDRRCEVVAICARHRARARAAARQWRVAGAVDDWEALVTRSDIDAVAIAVPPVVQPPIALATLRGRKHLWCEKPLAATVEEAAALSREAEEADVAHIVDFEFTAVPAWRALKRLLARGAIGRLSREDLRLICFDLVTGG